jgi:hypothetical protein
MQMARGVGMLNGTLLHVTLLPVKKRSWRSRLSMRLSF